ncbi:MAG: 3-dehydroquinate synthase, partial [Gluconacetobacter diazotrophicus]|nr:3-dehydroquinate synthase [Gluconacetobacter diazotrophicus]
SVPRFDDQPPREPPSRPSPRPPPGPRPGKPLVLVGLMGAGKTTVGRRLAASLGLPFRDADAEIERAAGLSVADIFARYGETEFRRGEASVIRRLLSGPPIVLATGGGAFADPDTRAAIRAGAVSVWLRCPLSVLVRRTAGRSHRPLLNAGPSPEAVLSELMARRHPFYAEADIVVDCGDETVERTAMTVIDRIEHHRPPRRVPVTLEHHRYEVVVGSGLLRRAGALLAPALPRRQAVVVTDETVAALHLPALAAGLDEAGIAHRVVVVPPGESSKSLAGYGALAESILRGPGAEAVERRTAVIALGGGVVGDLAGFAAATVMRGLPFVQVPTTLLAQVDSSVGGKTGINAAAGKNLLGAFHQPVAVLADTGVLSTLPRRELQAGFAEIAKAGLIADPVLFDWCERHGPALVEGDPVLLAEAVERACAFKAAVVAADEREQLPTDGRALLNLGHTFAHAIEAELGYDGTVLHGEAVGIGLALAFALSVASGLCDPADVSRVESILRAVGMRAAIRDLPRPPPVDALLSRMAGDKKRRDGRLAFVLARGVGRAFTTDAVDPETVRAVLVASGAAVPAERT